MSVWRNEEDFMRNMDNTLSEFYIRDKKVTTPKKLNVKTQKEATSWYDSDSDDDSNEKCLNADGSSSICPGMEPLDTLQMMNSIRMQVRNVVGDRYHNDVLEKYYKINQESEIEPSTSNETLGASFVQPQVTESSNNVNKAKDVTVNGHKDNVKKSKESSSKTEIDNSNYTKNKCHSRGKSYNNRGGSRGPSRYNNVAFSSLQSKENKSYNYTSKTEFPPL